MFSLVFLFGLLLIPIIPALEEWKEREQDRKYFKEREQRIAREEERWQAFLKREAENKKAQAVAHEKGMAKVKAREARKAKRRAELEANRLKREMKGADGEADAPDLPDHRHYSRYYG